MIALMRENTRRHRMRRTMQIVLATILLACGPARAEDWPARPITMVVPYAAGGPTDVIGRLFAQQMGEALGRQIVVENVPGAGGMTGASRVAQAVPDGYQVLFGGSGNLVFNQILYKKPLFNSVTDFTPVALLTEQSLVLIARKDLPADGLQDFVRHVKANKTSFGSAGAGSSTHLGCVMLNLAIGADATHVPYRGVTQAMQDLMGGRIEYYCDIIVTAAPQIQAGAVKAIAILSAARSSMLPDLRTANEQGLANLTPPTGTDFSSRRARPHRSCRSCATPRPRRWIRPRSATGCAVSVSRWSRRTGAARITSRAISRTTSRNGPPRSRRAAPRWSDPKADWVRSESAALTGPAQHFVDHNAGEAPFGRSG